MKLYFVLLIFTLLPACKPLNADVLIYERVIDGDTFVASGKKIRLWGIDAPEKEEPEALTATMYLEVLIEQGELSCSFVNKDKYQRDVMRCFSNGYDIAADMVKQGMATDYKKYSKGYYDVEEKKAKANKLGIWSGNRI